MGKEESQQLFAEAKKLYAEGNYEKALSLLHQLNKEYPDVFNIHQPIIQCYQHLGDVEKVREIVAELLPKFPEEKYQKKLARVGRWIKRQEEHLRKEENLSKDSQIDNEIADQIEEQPDEPVVEENGKEPDKSAPPVDEDTTDTSEDNKPPEETDDKASHPEKHSSFLRTLLIAAEVIFIICAGSAVMYLLATKTVRKLPELTADIIMEVSESEISGKLYLKNANTFRMEIMDQVFVTNEGQVRKLLVEDEKYINVNLGDVQRYNPLVGLSNFAQWVHLNNAKKVGKEKLQGYDCDIYQADFPGVNNSPSMSTRVWYCRQIKFPLKSENRTESNDPKLKGSVSVTLSNIQTEESLPEKIFEIPENYAEFVKKKSKDPDPEKLEGLVDNMEKILELGQFGDPTVFLEQFQ